MRTETIGLKIWDGYLSFDLEATPNLDYDLMSWLENMQPEDLLRGRLNLQVVVEVTDWFEDGPTLVLQSTEEQT